MWFFLDWCIITFIPLLFKPSCANPRNIVFRESSCYSIISMQIMTWQCTYGHGCDNESLKSTSIKPSNSSQVSGASVIKSHIPPWSMYIPTVLLIQLNQRWFYFPRNFVPHVHTAISQSWRLFFTISEYYSWSPSHCVCQCIILYAPFTSYSTYAVSMLRCSWCLMFY